MPDATDRGLRAGAGVMAATCRSTLVVNANFQDPESHRTGVVRGTIVGSVCPLVGPGDHLCSITMIRGAGSSPPGHRLVAG
jgi:hypothetical protein